MSPETAPQAVEDLGHSGRLEKLFNLTHDLLAVVDFRGHFETVSPSWTETLGWSEAELKATPIWELIHPEDLPAAQAEAQRFMESGGNLARFRNRYRCKDGGYRHISWTNYTDLEAQRVYCVARDVTTIAGQADELLELLQMTPDLIAIGPGSGRFDVVSPSWETVLGWSTEEMTSMSVLDLIHPDDLDASLAEAGRVKQTGTAAMAFENRYRCKDGSYRNLSWTAFSDTSRDRFYCIARDVTVLRRQQAQLDDQARAWETFANTLAHDVRSPIRSVGGLAEILKRGKGRLNDAETQRCLAMITERVTEIDAMTSKLLAFARTGTEALETRIIDMQRLVMHHVDLVLEAMDGAEPVFQVGQLPACRGDPAFIGVIVANLLQNACKFADPERPRVAISGEIASGYVRFSFADNGAGFAPDLRDRMWEPLVRGEAHRDIAGTGLGLATVKRIVENHDGSVHCESSDGAGSVFSFSLPL